MQSVLIFLLFSLAHVEDAELVVDGLVVGVDVGLGGVPDVDIALVVFEVEVVVASPAASIRLGILSTCSPSP